MRISSILTSFSLVLLLFLQGCSTSSLNEEELEEMRSKGRSLDAEVWGKGEDKPAWMHSSGGSTYKVGKPYKVNGVWYFPKEDYKYDEIGIASWYGPGFHEKTTANGEIFDMDLITAAHKTLPLPSVARVTNLENGRTVLVRINDRGPFVNERIIDLSKKAADLLGMLPRGTAKVRVELMPEESMSVASVAQKAAYASSGEKEAPLVSKAGVVELSSDLSLSEMSGEPDKSGHIETYKDQSAPQESLFNGGIYLQVGAFSKISNAKSLARTLSHLGTPEVVTFSLGNKTLYRVRFGPFNDITQANKLENAIVEAGHTDIKRVMP